MKKRLISFLLLLCLLLSLTGCLGSNNAGDASVQQEAMDVSAGQETMDVPEAAPAENLADVDVADSASLEEYLKGLKTLETPNKEYGENAAYIDMDENLVVRVLYPFGELEALDQAVEDWVFQTVSEYREEAVGSSQAGDSSELTVDYDSYLTDEKIVTVKFSGVFNGPVLAHPVDIIATFNADQSTGKLLSIEDILLPGGREALEKMVIADAGVPAQDVDEHILDLWAPTAEGLEITLERGSYLPMSSGTVALVYPYEKLEGILSFTASEQMATETGQEETDTESAQIQEDDQATEDVSSEDKEEQTDSSQATEENSPDDNVQTSEESQASAEEQAGPEENKPEQPAQTPSSGSGPMIALTFDDGPSAHTDRLLDLFSTYDGKGTFFVVGNSIQGREATLQRMAAAGHELGGHSWNHRQLTKLDVAELKDQIMNTRAKIYEVTGVDTTILRPPYGSYNDQVKATAAELGIVLVNWSVDTLDWKNKNADAVYKAIMSQTRDGSIILCHDLHKTTVDAMERVIPELIAQGYQLVTVSELLSHSEKEITAGQVYNNR